MFTGIIEEIGLVERVTKGTKSAKLRIRADAVLKGTRVGDSICTSGVCLTVTKLEGSCFEADVMAETIRRSKLGSLAPGSRVNLERAMQLYGRFGGHMVSGHIDGTGRLISVVREDNAVWLTVSAEDSLLRYVVEKGSVAIDGVSLTVAAVEPYGFKVSVIPHTGEETTLLQQRAGDTVNLECDIIGKYAERLLGMAPFERQPPDRAPFERQPTASTPPGEEWSELRRLDPKRGQTGKKEGLTEQFLMENGFC